MDLSILYILSSKTSYIKYSKFIKKHLVTKEVYTIFRDLKEWYETHDDVDWKSFSTWFKLIKHASYTEEVLDLYDAMFTNLQTFSPSSGDMEIIHALVDREYASRVSLFAGDIADGKPGDLSKVEDIMRERNKQIGRATTLEEKFVTDDVTEIMNTVMGTGNLHWRLKELELMLGPIGKGDFLTLAARPDSGKTTMLASEVTHMAPQLKEDELVFWFCNEESGRKVKFRVMQAALGITTKDFQKNPGKADTDYRKLTGERIKIMHDNAMHMNDVVQTLDQYEGKVGLIIIDQLHKIKGGSFGDDREYQRYAFLWEWARELSEVAPVINVHQLKGEAEGVLHPEMHMLYGSTTMVQGECDAIITLGRSHDPQFHENARGIYAPKNKLMGDLATDGKYRNTRFEIEIQPQIARFTGKMK